MCGTSEVGVDRKSVFLIKFHWVKGILGGNAKDCREFRFGEEGLAVVYPCWIRGDNSKLYF